MSEENDVFNTLTKTYGKDIRYDFKNDGTVDFVISPSGDIQLVGGSSSDDIEVRRQNAIQQIILRLLTPVNSLTDENGVPLPFGSNLYSLIGQKDTGLNRMAVRTYILYALSDYSWIEQILAIDVNFQNNGVMEVILRYKLIDDNEIIEQTLEYG